MAIFALSACDSDGTGPTGDDLSEEEASALSSAIVGQSLSVGLTAYEGGQASVVSEGDAAVAQPISFTTTVSDAPCPEGGTVTAEASIDGTVDSETGAVDLTFQLTATHDECGVVHEESGQVFVITTAGDDDLTLNMDLTIDAEQQLTASGDYSGRVDWTTEGREGQCSASAEFDMSGNLQEGTFSGSINGTACGVDFSRTTTVG